LNSSFQGVITASDAERRDLFLSAATRLGTPVQNVEKDFWVCWTLDVLFNGLDAGGPRLLFKGGTSLSKAFGLISRFSEDIDITVFRGDLGQAADVADLDALSGKKRRARLDAIRDACQAYIAGSMREQFNRLASTVIPEARFRLELDPEDKDGQTLLFWYPTVTATTGDYIRSAVKIECGAKSALDRFC
jgi:Nucleotidyl transferase AbiEii toxin, Type IV TA system